MELKRFDLNIEKVLEHWEIHHAIREIIANAIDEQQLTNTKEIEIFKDNKSNWHIRDYGRGIQYTHLTQKENAEKLKNSDKVIGKFGVGLKDAFATFDRKNIPITIISKFSKITTAKLPKHDFDNLKTLHALIDEPQDTNFIGTEVILENCKDEHINAAKNFFLMFSDEKLLEKTDVGEVYTKGKTSRIYIGGLLVAEEENFLFSYNLTSITAPMRKALNRERTNVGRTAYTPRVKDILLQCRSEKVAELLTADLSKCDSGKNHDELTWIDIAVHACKLLNSLKKVIFLTSTQMFDARERVDSAKGEGYNIIIVPETVIEKIKKAKDYNKKPIRVLEQYIKEFNESFEFKFINEKDLTEKEKKIFNKTKEILNLIGGKPKKVKEILISETMRLESFGYSETEGLWDGQDIIIKRNQLKDLQTYAGTLLHELVHAISGTDDISREFELELTKLLGKISSLKL
jgi:hypothetical protein